MPGCRVLVAANRDEYLARAASPPRFVAGENAYVAPRDLKAGGTWMGVNRHGLFVGLTNRPTDEPGSGRRSRGLLVVDALRDPEARSVAERMGRETEGGYSPFNLLYADGHRTFLTSQSEDRMETAELPPGIHVLCNRDIDDPEVPKIASIQAGLASVDLSTGLAAILEMLGKLLRTHAPGSSPLEGVCVHTEGYGTRSSALIALGREDWGYWFADGAPCETGYRDCSELFEELRAA